MNYRICVDCGDKKPLYDFYKRPGCLFGRMPQCNKCKNKVYLLKRKTSSTVENLEGEVWMDVDEFKGIIQISNYQRVKRLVRKSVLTEKLLTVTIRDTGYYCIRIQKDGIGYIRKVHRLYAIAFIPNPENKPCINHKDGNKLNNNKDNLEWVSIRENIHHAIDAGLINNNGENNVSAKLTNKQAKVLKRYFKIYPDVKNITIARKLNVSGAVIGSLRRGRSYKNI